MKLSPRAVAVFALLAAACASAPHDDDSTSDEEALRGACDLASSCPSAIKVLAAKHLDPGPTGSAHVNVVQNGAPATTARPFAKATTRKLRWDGSSRVVLSGAANGSAALHIDDFLLIEVLDDAGTRTDVGDVGLPSGATVDGSVPKRLAPTPSLVLYQGYAYDEIDISSLLPQNQSFRLRVTAYDFQGIALASDVYLRTTTAPAAPPPVVPAPPPADCYSLVSHRQFACDAPMGECHYPDIVRGAYSSKSACEAERANHSGLCSPNDCTWYTCDVAACAP